MVTEVPVEISETDLQIVNLLSGKVNSEVTTVRMVLSNLSQK